MDTQNHREQDRLHQNVLEGGETLANTRDSNKKLITFTCYKIYFCYVIMRYIQKRGQQKTRGSVQSIISYYFSLTFLLLNKNFTSSGLARQLSEFLHGRHDTTRQQTGGKMGGWVRQRKVDNKLKNVQK